MVDVGTLMGHVPWLTAPVAASGFRWPVWGSALVFKMPLLFAVIANGRAVCGGEWAVSFVVTLLKAVFTWWGAVGGGKWTISS